jgi:hypothetical protein
VYLWQTDQWDEEWMRNHRRQLSGH